MTDTQFRTQVYRSFSVGFEYVCEETHMRKIKSGVLRKDSH